MSSAGERPPRLDHLVPVPVRGGTRAVPAHDISGGDLGGRPVRVAVSVPGCWTLLLFVTATCDGCRPLVAACANPSRLGLGPADRVVVVVKDIAAGDMAAVRMLAAPLGLPPTGGAPMGDRGRGGGGGRGSPGLGSPSPGLRAAGSAAPALVASSAAWQAYRVLGAPFYVLVGDQGVVASEGVALGPEQVAADVGRLRPAARAGRWS